MAQVAGVEIADHIDVPRRDGVRLAEVTSRAGLDVALVAVALSA